MTTAIVTLISHYGKQLKLKMNACAATQLRSECKPIVEIIAECDRVKGCGKGLFLTRSQVAKIMAFYRASRWSDNDYFESVE